MKKLSPIISLLAVIAGIILGVLYWQSARDNDRLQQSLASTREQNQSLSAKLDTAQKLTERQQNQLHALDAHLGETKTELTETRSRGIVLRREITQLETDLKASRQIQRELQTDVNSLREDLAQARAAETSAESVASYQQTIRDLEQQIDALQSAATPSPSVPVLTTHRSRSTRVVSVGPASAFVVLNYGANHGALPTQKMDIRRGTKLLATVQISDVRKNYSIAQVTPDSLRDTLQKGDVATLTP